MWGVGKEGKCGVLGKRENVGCWDVGKCRCWDRGKRKCVAMGKRENVGR